MTGGAGSRRGFRVSSGEEAPASASARFVLVAAIEEKREAAF